MTELELLRKIAEEVLVYKQNSDVADQCEGIVVQDDDVTYASDFWNQMIESEHVADVGLLAAQEYTQQWVNGCYE